MSYSKSSKREREAERVYWCIGGRWWCEDVSVCIMDTERLCIDKTDSELNDDTSRGSGRDRTAGGAVACAGEEEEWRRGGAGGGGGEG